MGAGAVILMTAPLVCRRRWPLFVFGLVVLGGFVVAPTDPYAAIASITVAAYSVGAYGRLSLFSLIPLTAAAAVVALTLHIEYPAMLDRAAALLVTIPLWLVAYALRIRQVRADALEARAARLEQEHELATRVALAAERARIARELHDVVAHHVSVIVVQAGAALEVLPSSPDRARDALLAIESTGRGAMTELRGLLGVLSDTGDEVTMSPQPGVAQLDALLRQVDAAGLPAILSVQGQPRPLPAGIDLAVYRLIQEALTNALKYSGLARTEILLDYRETELTLEILDEGEGEIPSPDGAPGRGLIGMQERVALYGGTMEIGRRRSHGFAVRARLPLPRVSSD